MPDVLHYARICVGMGLGILVVLSLKTALQFHSYCEAMAQHGGETAAFSSLRADENGLNAFERTLFKRLMRNDLSDVTDESLRTRGDKLAAHLKQLRLLTILLVILVGVVYLPG